MHLPGDVVVFKPCICLNLSIKFPSFISSIGLGSAGVSAGFAFGAGWLTGLLIFFPLTSGLGALK